MSIKNVKTNSGSILCESRARQPKTMRGKYRFLKKMLPGDIVKINGVPWEYLGNGKLGTDAKPAPPDLWGSACWTGKEG